MVTLSVGKKCAVMLPKEFINPQKTPATGLIINQLVDSKRLVLIEEVWQFKGFPIEKLSEMCFPSGRIKHNNWGWKAIPSMVAPGKYIIIPVPLSNLMEPNSHILNALIKESIADFKRIYGF